MTVVIAHGQPKSGSTFLYMTSIEIANLVNDEDYYRLHARLFGEDFPSFMNELPVSLLHEIDKKVGPDRIFILKTHCDLSDGVAELAVARKDQGVHVVS